MTMLKGYNIPRPGPGDGEYGGFSGFAGYAQSPATHAYWQGQGIARTISALNGFGFRLTSDDFYTDRRGQVHYKRKHSAPGGVHGFGADPSMELPSLTPKNAAIAAAAAGFLTDGARRGVIWGALAYLVVDKFIAPVSGYGNACVTRPDGTLDCGTPYGPPDTVGEDPSLDPTRRTATGTNPSTSQDSFTLGPVGEGAMPPSGSGTGKLLLGLGALALAWKFVL